MVREVHRDPSREGDGLRSILRFGIGRLHTAKVAHAAHARWRCFFFVAPRGRRGPPAQGRRGKVYGRLTGYPELKPHDLRHGVAMWKCWSSTTMTSSRCAP